MQPSCVLTAGYQDAGVAVVQAEAVVICRDQERTTDIPLPHRSETVYGRLHPPLELSRPRAAPAGPATVGTRSRKEPRASNRRARHIASARCFENAAAGMDCDLSNGLEQGIRGNASLSVRDLCGDPSTSGNPLPKMLIARSASPLFTASENRRDGRPEPVYAV